MCIHLNSPHWFRTANQEWDRNLTGTAALKSGITNSGCFHPVRLLDYSQKLTIYWSIIPSFAAAPAPDGPLNHFLGVVTEFWEYKNISNNPAGKLIYSLSIFWNSHTHDESALTGCTRSLLRRTPASRWRSSSFCQVLFSVKPLMHSVDMEVPRLCSHDNSPTAHEPWPLRLCSKSVCVPTNLIPKAKLKCTEANWNRPQPQFFISCVIQLSSLSDLTNNYAKRGLSDRRWRPRWHLRYDYWDIHQGSLPPCLEVWRSHRAEAFSSRQKSGKHFNVNRKRSARMQVRKQ